MTDEVDYRVGLAGTRGSLDKDPLIACEPLDDLSLGLVGLKGEVHLRVRRGPTRRLAMVLTDMVQGNIDELLDTSRNRLPRLELSNDLVEGA